MTNPMPSPKEQFLTSYDQEHETTMKVLRAFPPEHSELRPHPRCKSARELAWVFVAAFRELVESVPDETLMESVKFFSGPGTLSDWPRIQLLWFLLSDEIRHRGQFSIYLRMADGKVPSIYGPSGDEPWM